MNIMGLISSKMEEIREAVIENIQEGLENSMSYEAYQELIAELLEKGESTTKGGSEALVPFSELNLRRMSRWDRRFEIEPEWEEKIKQAPAQTWIVLTEGWCGDAAHCVPIMQKIAEKNENIDLRIVLRDSNEDLIDRKSTRLNSSHVAISYAVFCLKKKKK